MLNIQLKDRSEGPVYLQVRNQIEEQIRNKEIASGEQLPQPAALAQKLSVDKGEIQRAYFELEQTGLIKKAARKDFLSGKEVTTYSVG
ncbi:MAG: GntR family transcriptional regulator [Pyrinomonadaceae bacterium]|nr:GntR family transcriptional regulator [Pyrinomonadaceae bacterium]MDQ3584722.1 GntR family transcriptional regulator [Acidobacteriota bacterium]